MESNTGATDTSVLPGRVEVIHTMQLAGIWLVRYPVKRHLAKKSLFPKGASDLQNVNGMFSCLLMAELLHRFNWCLGTPWEAVAETLLLAFLSKGINFLEISFRNNIPCKV